MQNSDQWRPSCRLDTLKARARLMQRLREWFLTRGYLEVETPIMNHYGVTDVHLANVTARFREHTYYLQTSPEYAMKRLLAAGSGPIFQFARVFRDDELGRWHNPEFTLLEWYQLDANHHDMMQFTDELLQLLLECPAMEKMTYQQAFLTFCSLDPLQASIEQLQAALKCFELDNVLSPEDQERDNYLFLLMSHIVEPALANSPSPVAIYGFPPTQAALAKIKAGVAERFEVYYQGVELANGFHELTDSQEQHQRFQRDLLQRRAMNLPELKVDEWFIDALNHGLPACTGVALGVDRLMALALGEREIARVMAFDFSRS